MRIRFIIHNFYPQHASGGERMCLNMAKSCQAHGHDVLIVLTQAAMHGIENVYEYDGLTVMPLIKHADEIVSGSDFIFTHLAEIEKVFYWCHPRALKRPICFISHNTHYYDKVGSFPDNISVVYNSQWMADKLKYPNRSIIVHPPVDYRKWDLGFNPKDNIYITLINVNANKGGKLFMAIVRAMPDRMFLGVRGSYDTQFDIDLPNLTMIDNTPDIEDIYRRTRVLLCPSKYESWGMCASEAMCSGIPIVYHKTPGLTENVGDAGIGLLDANPGWEDAELKGSEDPDGLDQDANLERWVKAIKRLDNAKQYEKYSNLARERSRQLDPLPQLDALDNFICNEVAISQEAHLSDTYYNNS